MRVSKDRIIEGVAGYIQDEILPKMERPVQIIMSIAVNSVMGNGKLVDSVFENDIVRTMLCGEGGTYDIENLMDSMRDAINEYGSFPVKIPAIPLVSQEFTLTLNADDIEAMKRRIEG